MTETLVSLTPAPKGAYFALYANHETRGVDRIEVPYFGVFRQFWEDGETYEVGLAAIVENDGSVVPAYGFDDFIGVLSSDDMKEGLPRWVVEELRDYFVKEVDN